MSLTLDSFVLLEQKFLWIVLVLTLLYFWSTHTFSTWSSYGIPFKRPLPFFGNAFKAICNIKTSFQVQQEIYYQFKDAPLVGTFTFLTPKLMVRDPALIEHVMVKDFSTFMDRGIGVDPNSKGLNAHLVNLTGNKWRNLRNKLTPVFTSGKMKGMMDQLEECTDRLVDHIKKEIVKGEPLEAKFELAGYTLDVIGSCAFGLDLNSIEDQNSTFRQMGEKLFAPSKSMAIRRWLRERWPKVLRIVNMRSIGGFDTEAFFTGIIKDTIKYREEKKVRRQDFIHLLMEIRKQEATRPPAEGELLMTDKVVTSNSFVFLLAGYETTATTLSFMLYELAKNPDIQDRLYREITKVFRKHDGQLSWDTLKDMEYLEGVTRETLRKYPPAGELRRISLKPYSFPKSDKELPAGTLFSIPVHSLHYDPKYYPNPEKFNPDRWSETNKHNLVKYTYLPFGDGPRICIGMRFALMEIKMAITSLIQEFTVKVNPKTASPLEFNPGAFLLAPIGGVWLDFSLRNKQDN